MRIRAIIEFDVEDDDGAPVDDENILVRVSMPLPDIIRNRLLGDGFLPSDLLIGTYEIRTELVVGRMPS